MVRLEDDAGEDHKGTLYEYRTLYEKTVLVYGGGGEDSVGSGRKRAYVRECHCGCTDPIGCAHAECAIACADRDKPAKGLMKWFNYAMLVVMIVVLIITKWILAILLLLAIGLIAAKLDKTPRNPQLRSKEQAIVELEEFAATGKINGFVAKEVKHDHANGSGPGIPS